MPRLGLKHFDLRSVEDLSLALRTTMGKARDDNNVAPIPYDDLIPADKYRFGYYLSGMCILATFHLLAIIFTLSKTIMYVARQPVNELSARL
jgi:hypothetical protein